MEVKHVWVRVTVMDGALGLDLPDEGSVCPVSKDNGEAILLAHLHPRDVRDARPRAIDDDYGLAHFSSDPVTILRQEISDLRAMMESNEARLKKLARATLAAFEVANRMQLVDIVAEIKKGGA